MARRGNRVTLPAGALVPAQTGCFTQVDPFPGVLSLPGTQHPYSYGLNNPTRYTDPSGMFVEISTIAAIAAGGFVGGFVADMLGYLRANGDLCGYDPMHGVIKGAEGALLAVSVAISFVWGSQILGLAAQQLGLWMGSAGLWNIGTGTLAFSSLLSYLLFAGKLSVDIVGFRGLGSRTPSGEHGLIRVGHVGVSFGHNSGRVNGFWPTKTARDVWGDDLLSHLGQGGVVSGEMQDDTDIFNRANELASQGIMRRDGKLPWVYMWRQNVGPFTYTSAYWRSQHSGISPYRLPLENNASMPVGYNNCATYTRELGLGFPIHYPENTGQLKYYVDKLIELGGGIIW